MQINLMAWQINYEESFIELHQDETRGGTISNTKGDVTVLVTVL
jgi:hypothetical protein